MAADGMDTGFGGVSEDAWRGFVRQIASMLEVDRTTTVFEVGCGAGAFLYELYESGCTVGGIDPSAALVSYARQVMPLGRFAVDEAASLDAADGYDVVVSCGVFHYFLTLDYARIAIARMAAKARHAIAILDVPDLARRGEALAYRRETLGAAAYEDKYDGLEHLYFDRRWLNQVLRESGLGRTHIEDQDIPGHGSSVHRFNAIGWKT